MKILKSAALIAAGLIALAGCQKAAVDTTADEAAIRAATTAWDAAYNAGDGDALAAHYAEDAVVLPPNAPAATGRAAIREFLATDSAATAGRRTEVQHPRRRPGASLGRPRPTNPGSFSVDDAAGSVVATGKYIGVFNKIDGKWLLVRDTWNTDAPPAPAAAAEPAAEAAS